MFLLKKQRPRIFTSEGGCGTYWILLNLPWFFQAHSGYTQNLSNISGKSPAVLICNDSRFKEDGGPGTGTRSRWWHFAGFLSRRHEFQPRSFPIGAGQLVTNFSGAFAVKLWKGKQFIIKICKCNWFFKCVAAYVCLICTPNQPTLSIRPL